ncbi:MAG: lyso-ornithine lipid O-acyltransferase [Sphingomonadales bacterium]|jgi:1-acyl-sn-glycerol-3-phosphate acyltransferase|nr:lyso-ornithine lipid O-acyltransferase [Sphingomonadales bacterium]
MRLILRAAAIALGLLVCLPLHYLSLLLLRRSRWPRRFLWWAGRAAGIRTRIEGRPLERDVLFAANHKSWLDILLLGGSAGAAFVAKEEVARWPVVGWLSRLNDSVYVARAERSGVRGQADALREALAAGRPVALFPEGTVSEPGETLPFRPSLFASLFPPLPQVRVQPVAIDYGAAIADIAWIEGETTAANARRILSRRGRMPVTLHFLEPIDPHRSGHRKTLAAAAEAEVLAALGASEADPARLYAPR